VFIESQRGCHGSSPFFSPLVDGRGCTSSCTQSSVSLLRNCCAPVSFPVVRSAAVREQMAPIACRWFVGLSRSFFFLVLGGFFFGFFFFGVFFLVGGVVFCFFFFFFFFLVT